MRKLFSKLGNLPATVEQKAVERRQEFARSVAAIRKDTGKPETRVIPYRCAETGRAYAVTFERVSPAHRFQVARIVKEDDRNSRNRNARKGFLSRKSATSRAFNSAEFDRSGVSCPWCGDASTTVRCNDCGETVCGGRVRDLGNGERTFACHDGCGATGSLVPYDQVHGSTGLSALIGGRRLPKLPKPTAQERLEDKSK